MTESRFRVRLRFSKCGDLRWIGHRDLIRLMERLFRRAQLKLSMSQGFHPKPRMSYASALAVGIEGLEEVLQLELSEEMALDTLLERLREQSPDGLKWVDAVLADTKPFATSATYEIEIPEDVQAPTHTAIDNFLAATSHVVQRTSKQTEVDVRGGVDHVELRGSMLRFVVPIGQNGAVRPREVLQALGLEQLESLGSVLKRTRLELAD